MASAPHGLRIVEVMPSHAREVREVTLAMLTDSPAAFVESLEHARARTDVQWRERAARTAGLGRLGLAVVPDGGGPWVGRADAWPDAAGRATLHGFWVAPPARGLGVADVLLEAVERWVGAEHAAGRLAGPVLRLEVHEANARALAFYRRHGYAPTGETAPFPTDPTARELVLAREVTATVSG